METIYEAVPLDEEQQTSEKESLLLRLERRISFPKSLVQNAERSPHLIWILHGMLLTVSFTLFAAAFCLRFGKPSVAACTGHISPYSPAESVVEYQTVRYNITPAIKDSDYIGYGAAVDKAWDHITYDVGDQMITQDELDRLGLDPASLKIKNPRTGEEGYRVGIQAFHQLHCLNLLRQDSYRDYYSHHGGDIEVQPEDLRGHLDHCLEILRIALMCQSDTGVFTFKYYEGYEGHWPDFSTLHTCRNFESIRDWAFQNAVVFGDEE
ncbi:hypothetical protein EDB81DRAFT_880947 [Dactylonectria macrodidyma]|uniref:Uncharacterized protein n=1 Tax=Dactylonectria macrodidyma TaxID=307937 RepID=A0A9P9F736_9HYPO|nr:hypothetical protein EDB81DRAFT_880947 [Dactylonectria macrodidyma]